MKVIFTENVPGVALKGDVKRVKNGFFRNFLLPRSKAIPATESLLAEWEERRKRLVIAKEQLRSKLEETKKRLAGAKFRIEKKVTAKGTLYGGVKAADITKVLRAECSIEVPESAVIIDKPIKAVGTYEIRINFGEGVETLVSVEVVQK